MTAKHDHDEYVATPGFRRRVKEAHDRYADLAAQLATAGYEAIPIRQTRYRMYAMLLIALNRLAYLTGHDVPHVYAAVYAALGGILRGMHARFSTIHQVTAEALRVGPGVAETQLPCPHCGRNLADLLDPIHQPVEGEALPTIVEDEGTSAGGEGEAPR